MRAQVGGIREGWMGGWMEGCCLAQATWDEQRTSPTRFSAAQQTQAVGREGLYDSRSGLVFRPPSPSRSRSRSRARARARSLLGT